jgi:hypothetical protein
MDVENEVTGAGGIPETLEIELNVYSTPGLEGNMQRVHIDLEIDQREHKFRLTPNPDELEDAVLETLQWLQEQLRQRLITATILVGSPEKKSRDDDEDNESD